MSPNLGTGADKVLRRCTEGATSGEREREKSKAENLSLTLPSPSASSEKGSGQESQKQDAFGGGQENLGQDKPSSVTPARNVMPQDVDAIAAEYSRLMGKYAPKGTGWAKSVSRRHIESLLARSDRGEIIYALRETFEGAAQKDIPYIEKTFFADGGAMGIITLSCLSWNWRGRSSVKITERTHGKTAKALHRRREGGHPETALVGQSASFRSV
jgi:hypothetical protein